MHPGRCLGTREICSARGNNTFYNGRNGFNEYNELSYISSEVLAGVLYCKEVLSAETLSSSCAELQKSNRKKKDLIPEEN